MAEVALAPAAHHLRPDHAVGGIRRGPDAPRPDGLKETWPAACARELRIRPEEKISAGGATVGPLPLKIPVLPGERAFRPLPARNLIDVFRQHALPLGVRNVEM